MDLHIETEQLLASLTTAIEHHRQNGGDYVGIWNRASGVVDNLVRSNAALRARLAEVEGELEFMRKNYEAMTKAGVEQQARATRAEAHVEKLEREAKMCRCEPHGNHCTAKRDAALAECEEGK